MKRVNLVLAVFVAVELIGAGALLTARSRQPVPPRPNLARLDSLTAASLDRLRQEACNQSVGRWQELAQAWLAWGYLAEAEAAYRRAADLDSDSFDVAYGWAFSLERLGRAQEAARQFEHAAALASPEMRPTCWYHVGRCWLREEDVSRAETAFEQVAEFPPAALQLAKLEIRSGRIEEGISRLERMPASLGQSLQPLMLRMTAERDRGNPDAAAEYGDRIERTVATFPVDDTAEFLAPIRLRYGVNRLVANCDQQAASAATAGKADCLSAALGKMDFWNARRLIPTVSELELNRGNADEALRLIGEQIEHSNVTPPILETRGAALAMKGRHDAARQDWERSAALRGTVSTYERLAEDARRRGDGQMERRYHALALSVAGKTAFRENRLDQAIDWLEQAVTLGPENGQAWYYLGECRRALDESNEAREAYEKCLAIAPGHGRAAERLERMTRQP